MSQQQWAQTVEAERAFREEMEAREIETANEILAEMRASRDDEFREEIEEKYPQIKALWPGRTI